MSRTARLQTRPLSDTNTTGILYVRAA